MFAPGMSAAALEQHGLIAVKNAASADVAILRVEAPHELLHPSFFFGSRQLEGSLDFKSSSWPCRRSPRRVTPYRWS